MPEDASGFDEITLTFDPKKACIPDGHGGLSGLDSVFMESSAVLLFEEKDWWHHRISTWEMGLDSTLPCLYLNDDSLFSITFTPSAFYGTGTELITGIVGEFYESGRIGLDHGAEGCQYFYIPFELDTAEVSFSVDLSYQTFLKNFDPLFDYVDVVGDFNNWGDPSGTDLTDPDGDSIYSVTMKKLFAGQTIKYRFRRNRNDGTSETLDSSGYRTYTIQEGENNLSHWYNDQEPSITTLTVNVNMNYGEELGLFNPGTDIVEMEMGFPHLDSFSTDTLSDPDSNGIYSVVIDSLWVGSNFNYIVHVNGSQPGDGGWPWYTVKPDANRMDFWWAWMDPESLPDLFFSGYLDGEGNNNALEIMNPTDSTLDLAGYGILYTLDGSDWLGPLNMAGTLESNRTWLMVHPGFDFSAIDSALAVDTAWAEPCNFNGNDALALVKLYDGGSKWRILDQIGLPGNDPGIGWGVAGIPEATSLHRLERKQLIGNGRPDWNASAGISEYDSEWKVYGPEVPFSLGKTAGFFNYDNLWTEIDAGVSNTLNGFAATDNGWEFAVGDMRTVIYKETGMTQWNSLVLDIPEKINLNSIFFTDSLNGWMTGDEGIILHTTNGIDWTSQTAPTSENLNDIFFTDSENGWAVGANIALHTIDGGRTWEGHFRIYWAEYNKVHFTDREHGWIVGDMDYVIYTDNGGVDWNRMTEIQWIDGSRYKDIYFINSNCGWIVSNRGIYSTKDGGSTWTKQIAPQDDDYRIHFTSPLVGWLISDQEIYSTRDGGITWSPQYFPDVNKPLKDLYFSSSNNGWIVGENGLILHTEDGWISQTSPTGSNLRAITFSDDSIGWIVGNDGTVLKTVNAGQTWDTINLNHADNPNAGYFDIFFIDPMTGWIGGDGTFATKDGGKTWDRQGPMGYLYAVYFIDRSRGWAVGNGGEIARTTDGGETWIRTPKGTENFYDVYFVDSLNGWLVGEYGRILHSENGGISWTNQSGGYTNTRLETVYFKDTLNGIAISDNEILRTENGGASWEVSSGFGGHPKLHFIDSLSGWVTSEKDEIWHTRDGGINWLSTSTDANEYLSDQFFQNERIGWAVGDNGTIMRTSSGGCKDPFVNLPGIARICEGEEIILSVGENYTYSWNTGSTGSSITVSSAGWYRVDVGNRCGAVASDSVYLEVIIPLDFQFVVEGETAFCMGEDVLLTCFPNTTAWEDNWEDNYLFRWENDTGFIDSESYRADTGGYISVSIKDHFGCIATDSILLFEQNPFNEEEICLVTIDLHTGKNMIIWDKTPDVGTLNYNIYRESGAIGKYELIGTIPYDQLSIFKDTNSLPEARQYLYKMASVDSCGNESEFSNYHKPLFLQYVSSVGGVNLQWSDYVIEGNPFDFVTYEIYRGSDSISLNKITEVPASLDRYIDTDGDVLNHKYYYRVAGVKETPCFPSGTGKAETEYRSSISNMEDNGIGTGLNDFRGKSNNALLIYPNPFSDRTLIKFPNPDHSRYQLYISDLNGKIVKTIENIHQESFELSSDGLKKGIFFIELRGSDNFRGKIIIQ